MPRLTRSLAVLLLVLLLVPTALHAAGPQQNTSWNVLAWVWSFLQPDNGCEFDPDGHCRLGATIDNGCEFDPSGRCRTAATLDNGCMVDPNGRCGN